MSMSRVILLLVGLNTVITVGAVVGGYLYLRPIINGTPAGAAQSGTDLAFYPIEKIIVNLPGQGRERYVVLDLALQADSRLKAGTLKQVEPLVRHSVISSLSQLSFDELRQLSIDDVQGRIETRMRQDFASKGLTAPFSGTLVSKLLVQ